MKMKIISEPHSSEKNKMETKIAKTESAVNEIVKSLSFEVEAIPQDNILQLTSTANSTPLNVKIKVRKKQGVTHAQNAVITLPKIGRYNEKSPPERIRLVSSDQTIMAFNMHMESGQEAVITKKPGKTFFGLFKAGGCLDPSNDEDNYPYLAKPIPIISEKNKTDQPTTSEVLPLNDPITNKDDTDCKTSKDGSKMFILGKCKPGGCLDPPFGEDKYSYLPAKSTTTEVKDTTKKRTSIAIKESDPQLTFKKDINKDPKKKTTDKHRKSSEDSSVTSLYKAESKKNKLDSSCSSSLITYPPDFSELQMSNGACEKNVKNRSSIDEKHRRSFSNTSENYFQPRKESVIKKKIADQSAVTIKTPYRTDILLLGHKLEASKTSSLENIEKNEKKDVIKQTHDDKTKSVSQRDDDETKSYINDNDPFKSEIANETKLKSLPTLTPAKTNEFKSGGKQNDEKEINRIKISQNPFHKKLDETKSESYLNIEQIKNERNSTNNDNLFLSNEETKPRKYEEIKPTSQDSINGKQKFSPKTFTSEPATLVRHDLPEIEDDKIRIAKTYKEVPKSEITNKDNYIRSDIKQEGNNEELNDLEHNKSVELNSLPTNINITSPKISKPKTTDIVDIGYNKPKTEDFAKGITKEPKEVSQDITTNNTKSISPEIKILQRNKSDDKNILTTNGKFSGPKTSTSTPTTLVATGRPEIGDSKTDIIIKSKEDSNKVSIQPKIKQGDNIELHGLLQPKSNHKSDETNILTSNVKLLSPKTSISRSTSVITKEHDFPEIEDGKIGIQKTPTDESKNILSMNEYDNSSEIKQGDKTVSGHLQHQLSDEKYKVNDSKNIIKPEISPGFLRSNTPISNDEEERDNKGYIPFEDAEQHNKLGIEVQSIPDSLDRTKHKMYQEVSDTTLSNKYNQAKLPVERDMPDSILETEIFNKIQRTSKTKRSLDTISDENLTNEGKIKINTLKRQSRSRSSITSSLQHIFKRKSSLVTDSKKEKTVNNYGTNKMENNKKSDDILKPKYILDKGSISDELPKATEILANDSARETVPDKYDNTTTTADNSYNLTQNKNTNSGAITNKDISSKTKQNVSSDSLQSTSQTTFDTVENSRRISNQSDNYVKADGEADNRNNSYNNIQNKSQIDPLKFRSTSQGSLSSGIRKSPSNIQNMLKNQTTAATDVKKENPMKDREAKDVTNTEETKFTDILSSKTDSLNRDSQEWLKTRISLQNYVTDSNKVLKPTDTYDSLKNNIQDNTYNLDSLLNKFESNFQLNTSVDDSRPSILSSHDWNSLNPIMSTSESLTNKIVKNLNEIVSFDRAENNELLIEEKENKYANLSLKINKTIALQDVISEESEWKPQNKTFNNNDNENALFDTDILLLHNIPEDQTAHDFTQKSTEYLSSDLLKSNPNGNNEEKYDKKMHRQHQNTVNSAPDRNENDVIYPDGRKPDFTNNIDSRNSPDSKYRHQSPTGKRDVKFEKEISNALVHNFQSTKTENMNNIPNIKSDENEQGIILDIGLQNFVGVNNQRIIKSFDSTMYFERYPDDKITSVKTVVKSRSTEILIPIDSRDYIKLSFGSGSLDLKGELNSSNDGVIINSESRIARKGHDVKYSIMRSKSAAPLQARHSRIDKTLAFLYEHQLVPLQKIIINLKEDIDILSLEQDLLKENIINMKIKKSLRINRTTKCACSCGLKKLNLS